MLCHVRWSIKLRSAVGNLVLVSQTVLFFMSLVSLSELSREDMQQSRSWGEKMTTPYLSWACDFESHVLSAPKLASEHAKACTHPNME